MLPASCVSEHRILATGSSSRSKVVRPAAVSPDVQDPVLLTRLSNLTIMSRASRSYLKKTMAMLNTTRTDEHFRQVFQYTLVMDETAVETTK